jgi:chromatin remodeling complex protein RSC6
MAPRKKTPPATDSTAVVATDASVVTDANVAATTDVASPVTDVVEASSTLDTINKTCAVLALEIKNLGNSLKVFQKEYNKLLKSQKVRGKRTPNPNVKRNPSGFAKPAKLIPDLCEFLGIPSGSCEPRTVVTSKLNEYIKSNNLQNPENRKFILPDEKLKKLLRIAEGDSLSYFNLQRCMKHLFEPATVPVA